MLYRVQATYRYDKEDADELSFEIGETVNVIEYDDPEDQVRRIYFWLSKHDFDVLHFISRRRDG